MNADKTGGPAFPVPDSHDANGQVQYGANGMTLRDWFAGQALAGLLGNSYISERYGQPAAERAIDAYIFADAMLAERNKEKP
jgi:hypothetical protein